MGYTCLILSKHTKNKSAIEILGSRLMSRKEFY